jgi:hypothetical protein
MGFEHPEDGAFFVQLFCADGESVDGYAFLFDFRDPMIKRREFNSVRPSLSSSSAAHLGRQRPARPVRLLAHVLAAERLHGITPTGSDREVACIVPQQHIGGLITKETTDGMRANGAAI